MRFEVVTLDFTPFALILSLYSKEGTAPSIELSYSTSLDNGTFSVASYYSGFGGVFWD
jgi:hypothetical protein